MNRLIVSTLGLLIVTACGDAVAPTAPRIELARAPGFPLTAPSITHTGTTYDAVSGKYSISFQVSWTSSESQLPAYDHVSFDLRRGATSADKDSPEVASANATGSSTALGSVHTATLTDVEVDAGTYYYCATVMAKSGTGAATITYHSVCSDAVEVYAGSVTYSFVRIAAQNNSTETPSSTTLALSKNGNIVLYFVLKSNGVLVDDCTTVPASSVTGSIVFTVQAAGPFDASSVACNYNGASNRYVYQVTFPNAGISPAPSNGGSFNLKINGATVTTYNFTTS